VSHEYHPPPEVWRILMWCHNFVSGQNAIIINGGQEWALGRYRKRNSSLDH